jgi:hypothetical protein
LPTCWAGKVYSDITPKIPCRKARDFFCAHRLPVEDPLAFGIIGTWFRHFSIMGWNSAHHRPKISPSWIIPSNASKPYRNFTMNATKTRKQKPESVEKV